MQFVCRINRKLYSCVAKDISTDEVIITSKQIAHIFEGHAEREHANVMKRLAESIQSPDYILRDADPRTAIVF